jgi:hemerythrin superfamily protein
MPECFLQPIDDAFSATTSEETYVNNLLAKMSPTATNMIRMDHSHVLMTFHKYEIDSTPGTKQALVNTACLALEIHAQLEEEIFYPAMRASAGDGDVVAKSIPEHQEMKRLIGILRAMEPGGPEYDQTFMELMRDVLHHVADEETVLLPDAERRIPDQLGELGARMTKRRLELAGPRAGEIALNTVRGMPASSMLMAAGAVVAGSYLMSRVFSSRRA